MKKSLEGKRTSRFIWKYQDLSRYINIGEISIARLAGLFRELWSIIEESRIISEGKQGLMVTLNTWSIKGRAV